MSLVYTALAGCLLLPILLGYVLCPFLFQDLCFYHKFTQHRRKVRKLLQRVPPVTVLDRFLRQVRQRPDSPFLLFEDQVHTFLEVDQQSNRFARALKEHAGVQQGDCVALFLGNEPAYIWVWLGLAKLGCPMACLNYNIRTKSLLHCFQASGARVLIAAPELKKAVEDVLPVLKAGNVKVFYLGKRSPTDGVDSLLDKVESASDQPIPASLRSEVTPQSTALYIYTSGTTGHPKAAIVTQGRFLTTSSLAVLVGLSSKDIMYIPLPLYHSAGFMIGVRGCIETGAACVLRRKFSASQFWNDCRKYDVTVIQYIGEVLRYLCNSPKKDNDRDHRVRTALGNGLRADVWKEFTGRFGNIRIWEFYAATEGNISFLNYTSQIGAAGRVYFMQKRWAPFELIKYDSENDQPVRGADGLCVRAPPGEAGLLVAKITAQAPFVGYAGEEAQTQKKRMKDVFQKGDSYFNSGDLLMIDRDNFVYFHDRVGDTFRWKGENVATTEVQDILTMMDFIQEVNVYGVAVPHHEGRIGMASLRLRAGRMFDGETLYRHVVDYLPSYARPRFARVQEMIEVTSTFKQRKVTLVEEGFDPAKITDPLYFLDDDSCSYTPMSQDIYSLIVEKKIKL